MNNFSGISEPYALKDKIDGKSSPQNSGVDPNGLISEERDLNKLNEDLDKIQNLQPFASTKDPKQTRMDRIR